MFLNLHNINYKTNLSKALFSTAFKKIIFCSSYLFFSVNCSAQTFDLPNLDSLFDSIDSFYTNLSDAETHEFKQESKGRWLNYLPSPGYSPFTGGFTFSLNLSAPVQEAKAKKLSAFKIASIKKINLIQASSLKNEVFADYEACRLSILEYHSKDSSVQLRHKAFNLYRRQYERNELTPSAFIANQVEMETLTVQRIAEANNIYKSILSLIIKCKKPMQTNAPAF